MNKLLMSTVRLVVLLPVVAQDQAETGVLRANVDWVMVDSTVKTKEALEKERFESFARLGSDGARSGESYATW